MPGWTFELPGGRALVVGETPLIAGILNCTPDSFSDGGSHLEPDRAVRAGLSMLAEGADLIDVGGESTRPGALPVPAETQIDRILPVIRALRGRTEAPISVDTQSAVVAEAAFAAGADILNDVSACGDPGMRDVLGRRAAPVILMHMKGTPLDMQVNPEYPGGLVPEILQFFRERLDLLRSWGIDASRTILDPGIGFGKRMNQCFELIRNIETFQGLGRPIFIGASRKGFIDKALERAGMASDSLKDRDLGTLILSSLALSRGASFLRVHNVPYAKACVSLHLAVRGGAAAEPRDS